MKRLMTLIVAGILLVPVTGWADNFIQPVSGTMGACQFMNSSCPTHLGTDRMASENTDVFAISRGYAYYYKSNAGSFGGCNVNGVALWIKHRKENGQYFWALYGHIKNSIVTIETQVVTVNISPGQKIAEIADYYPCYNLDGTCGTSHCPHLHFGIWDSQTAPCGEPGSVRCNGWGYGSQGSFVDPNDFLAIQHPYPETPAYKATKTGQNTSVTPWLPAGGAYTLWVDYRNDGTVTWKNSGPVSGGYVELRSVDGGCNLYSSFCAYDAATWINRQGIGPALQASVPNGSTARFQFVARAANTSGSCVQWVAPWANGQCMDGWGGVNFTIQTDADAPTNNGPPVASPATNTVNSFSFSWPAYSDPRSGVKEYHWNINSVGDTLRAGIIPIP
ncbi:MAG: M23 family metallopeptidase, partial [Bacteroidota bacterium]